MARGISNNLIGSRVKFGDVSWHAGLRDCIDAGDTGVIRAVFREDDHTLCTIELEKNRQLVDNVCGSFAGTFELIPETEQRLHELAKLIEQRATSAANAACDEALARAEFDGTAMTVGEMAELLRKCGADRESIVELLRSFAQ